MEVYYNVKIFNGIKATYLLRIPDLITAITTIIQLITFVDPNRKHFDNKSTIDGKDITIPGGIAPPTG